MAFPSISLNDGKLLQHCEFIDSGQLESAPAAAEPGFQSWKEASCTGGLAIVDRSAALLQTHVEELAPLETLEKGSRIDEARTEVGFSVGILSEHVSNGELLWGCSCELGDAGIQECVNAQQVRRGRFAAADFASRSRS